MSALTFVIWRNLQIYDVCLRTLAKSRQSFEMCSSRAQVSAVGSRSQKLFGWAGCRYLFVSGGCEVEVSNRMICTECRDDRHQ